ncbi:hypothetical protein JX266_014330, partial [Neoarthrinium moseri]
DERADVILMQEPWVGTPPKRRMMIKTHPNYNVFSPVDSWDSDVTRPRSLIYVRKHLHAQQLRPYKTRDVTWAKVRGITFVSVYRSGSEPVGVDNILEAWTPPLACVVAGDFNAGDNSWDASNPDYHGGAALANTMAEHGLDLISEPDVPTHDGGNVLDLAFSDVAMAEAAVADTLHSTSDHETLRIVVPVFKELEKLSRPDRWVVRDEDLPDLVAMVESRLHELPELGHTGLQLDGYARVLCDMIQSSVKIKGKKTGRFRPTAWWNDECRTAVEEHRKAVKGMISQEEKVAARREFRRVVRQAKREYWQALIDGADSPKEMFRIVAWHKLSSGLSAPPITANGTTYESQLDKAKALRKATLERNNASNDINDPWSVDIQPRTSIHFDLEISLEEVEACTVGSRSTSPGVDGLTVKVLKACWPVIGERVRDLFQTCIANGHHPAPFKVAEVVMIPKPGKKNYSDPGTYRPISLLSCLGKGLERLLARRMAWTVVERGILASQHFGALPKRSATDLVAALIHDIEQALDQGLVATLVTADVKGAFDAALVGRLVLRMRKQGWPDLLIRWVQSFMTGRSARVRFEDILTETEPLSCGLPQGSPASPILYMLYTEPICRQMGTRRRRFGYADDIAMLSIGRTLQETAQRGTEKLRKLIRWGRENAVEFDPGKTEIMHFSRKKNSDNPTVMHGAVEKTAKDVMRWLGIFLDRKLSFRGHVKKWATKANRVANHIRSLCNTVRGLPVDSTRKAVIACVVPVLMHGLEAWYPGVERTDQNGLVWATRVKALLQQMDSVLRTSMRAILPVWRTHPTHIMHFEAQIPPAEIIAESIRRRHGLRLGRVDKNHPLVPRLRIQARKDPT